MSRVLSQSVNTQSTGVVTEPRDSTKLADDADDDQSCSHALSACSVYVNAVPTNKTHPPLPAGRIPPSANSAAGPSAHTDATATPSQLRRDRTGDAACVHGCTATEQMRQRWCRTRTRCLALRAAGYLIGQCDEPADDRAFGHDGDGDEVSARVRHEPPTPRDHCSAWDGGVHGSSRRTLGAARPVRVARSSVSMGAWAQ